MSFSTIMEGFAEIGKISNLENMPVVTVLLLQLCNLKQQSVATLHTVGYGNRRDKYFLQKKHLMMLKV